MFLYDNNRRPPQPIVRIRIVDNRRGVTLPAHVAVVDTGADCSALPRSVTGRVKELDYEIGRVKDYDGEESLQRFVRILSGTIQFLGEDDSVILEREFHNLRLLVIGEGLLGRDVLNSHYCELDGPGLKFLIR